MVEFDWGDSGIAEIPCAEARRTSGSRGPLAGRTARIGDRALALQGMGSESQQNRRT